MACSEAFGILREVTLPDGPIRYRGRGDGPPAVGVHGRLVNARLRGAVVTPVAEVGFRYVAPDRPFAPHEAGRGSVEAVGSDEARAEARET